MIGRTRGRMMSSSLTGQTKGKESCSFIELVFTTVVLTYGISGLHFMHRAAVFLKPPRHGCLPSSACILCVLAAWFIKRGKVPIRILLSDLVVIYPVGTIHEYNYCLTLKSKCSWIMLWMLCTKCLSFRNLSLGSVWLHLHTYIVPTIFLF